MITKLYQNEQCVLMDRWQVYDFCPDTRVQDVPEKVYQIPCRDEDGVDYTVYYHVNHDNTIGDLWCVCRYDGDYDQFHLTWIEGYSKKYTIEKEKELSYEEKINKKTVELYPHDAARITYNDIRLKNANGTQSIYKLMGNYWELPCKDESGNDYLVYFEYDQKREDFSDYDADEVYVVLKDYTMCDDWRICALWTVDDEVDYIIDWAY